MHQNDGLERCPAFVRQLVERLLFAPVLLQQGVAHDTGRAFEARAEVESHVRARFGAAAARQFDLKPAEKANAQHQQLFRCRRRGSEHVTDRTAVRGRMTPTFIL